MSTKAKLSISIRLEHIRLAARAMRPVGLFPGVTGPGEAWVLS